MVAYFSAKSYKIPPRVIFFWGGAVVAPLYVPTGVLSGVDIFQVMVTDQNTMFVENIIFIMKNILENKTEQPCEHLGIASIELLMLSIVR